MKLFFIAIIPRQTSITRKKDQILKSPYGYVLSVYVQNDLHKILHTFSTTKYIVF